jgi:hypothetical protein
MEGRIMSIVRQLAPWLIGVVSACALPAQAQNINAGKTPAQIFADTCASCHRSARELRRTSTSFLRSHYTTGSDEASAMASYLAGVGSDPRAAQQKRVPGTTGTTVPSVDAARPPTNRPSPGEQAKSTPGQPASKAGRRVPPASVEAAAAAAPTAPEEKPPEPVAAAPATPVLAMPAAAPPMPVASEPVAAAATPAPPAPLAPQAPPALRAATTRPKPVLEPFEE